MLNRNRFERLWQRVTGRNESGELFVEFVARYSEPRRAYHNVAHIADCLAQFDRYFDAARRPDEVEMAIWFHDAIYDPRMTNNEDKSAAWANQCLTIAGVDPQIIGRVERLILSTKHSAIPDDCDERLLVDIDLSILGRDWETFDRYDKAIRTEYEWVAEEKYRLARTEVLRRFIARPRIFLTDLFYNRFESAARDNLSKAIKRLSPPF